MSPFRHGIFRITHNVTFQFDIFNKHLITSSDVCVCSVTVKHATVSVQTLHVHVNASHNSISARSDHAE